MVRLTFVLPLGAISIPLYMATKRLQSINQICQQGKYISDGVCMRKVRRQQAYFESLFSWIRWRHQDSALCRNVCLEDGPRAGRRTVVSSPVGYSWVLELPTGQDLPSEKTITTILLCEILAEGLKRIVRYFRLSSIII